MNSTSGNNWRSQLTNLAQLYARNLSSEEFEIWERILEPITRKALAYACDNWARNGRFFPKPIDILDLVNAYKLSREPVGAILDPHYGKGYNEGDILALWKLVSVRSIALGRNLTQAEIWEQLDGVDAKRPRGTPTWRTQPRMLSE